MSKNFYKNIKNILIIFILGNGLVFLGGNSNFFAATDNLKNESSESESIAADEEVKKVKMNVELEENRSYSYMEDIENLEAINSFFVYSSNTCVTINLYNIETIKLHSYIDCLGYLMEYLGVNAQNSDYYDVRFQGNIHAIHKNDIKKVLEKHEIKSFPYYINIDGNIHHYIEGNPELDDSYIHISALGKAPSWMLQGKKYYSFSGIYFTDDITKLGEYTQTKNAVNNQNPYYDYYLYLPLRTRTSYSADDLDKAFDYFLYNSSYDETKSVLRNSGKYFIDTEAKYGTNALVVLSMAIHESAYGTSNFARDRFNLFGVDAVDSNPGQAATFKSVEEGIKEQGNYLSWVYADADYQYGTNYYGSNLGNKGSGMNVKYASDPFWGEKIATHMSNIDDFLSKKDFQKYGLAIAKQGTNVYRSSTGENYLHKYKESTSLLTYMYPVVTTNDGSTESFQKINLEPPYNPDNVVGPRYPDGGRYYWLNAYVSRNDIINVNAPKENTSIVKDGAYIFYLDENSFIKYSEEYANQKKIRIYNYYDNTKYGEHVGRVKYKFDLIGDGSLKLKSTVEYDVNQKQKYIYIYNDNVDYGTHVGKAKYRFELVGDGSLKLKSTVEYDANQKQKYIYIYNENTVYGNHVGKLKYRFEFVGDGSLKLKSTIEYDVNQKQKYIYIYNENTVYGNHVGKLKYRFEFIGDGSLKLKSTIEYDANQKQKYIYIYNENTVYGNHVGKLKYRFEFVGDGSLKLKSAVEYDANQKQKYIYIYNENTVYGNHVGKLKYRFEFVGDGSLKLKSAVEYDINQKQKYIYIYIENTIYGSHVGKLKYRFDLVGDGTLKLKSAVEYDINQKQKYIYIYAENTEYGNHKDRVESVIIVE